jgi:transposase
VSAELDRVIIGMDLHKRSITVEVMTAEETVRGGGRYATDHDGYRTMLQY